MQPSEHTSGPTKRKRAPRYRRVELAPFQLTERDLDLVEAVGRHGVVRSTDLDHLFPTSPQQLRRRLKFLFHAGYLARPKGEIASAMLYLLTEQGATLLAARRGILLSPKPDTIKLVQLTHTLDITDFMVGVEAACRQSAYLSFEPFPDILSRSPPQTRTEPTPEKWKVDIKHRGLSYSFHLQPDGIFSICHREAALEGDPRARKYFFLESDTGTMPIERAELYQSSILRKYLSYAESFRADLHRSRFSMNNMRVLFVGKNRRRIERMIDAFHAHLKGLVSPRLFLFADRETLFAEGTALFDCPWLDGEGKEHTLFA